MVRQPAAPQNSPKSDDGHKSERSLSKLSNISDKNLKREKSRRHSGHSGHSERSLRKRGTPGSTFSKISEEAEEPPKEVHCSCERLQNELFQFIDEFIESEEYKDYVKFKASIIRKDEEVQYDQNDWRVNSEENVVQERKTKDFGSLSKKALRIFFLEMQIERYTANLANEEVVRKQEETIRLIRRKIAEVKAAFFCHRAERECLKRAKQQTIIQKFINTHKIDISKMLSTHKLGEAILDVERKLRMKRKGHKNNTKSIVEKLVKEYKNNRPKHKKIKKFTVPRSVTDEKTNTIMHIKGKSGSKDVISLVYFRHSQERILKAFRDAGVCINDEQLRFSVKNFLCNKNIGTENQLDTTDKSMQESEFKDISSQIPYEESLYKIKLDVYAKDELGTIKSFLQFEDLLEARQVFCLCEKERRWRENEEILYPDDEAFSADPAQIVIKDFKPGKVYTRKLVLISRAPSAVKIRLFKMYTEDSKHSCYFEVEPDELKVVRPGLPLRITVKFRPTPEMDVIIGLLVFLVCYKSVLYKHVIPVECTPSSSDIIIEPQRISFGPIPIWKFVKNPPEISERLKVKCFGKSVHKLVIKKILDPLKLDLPPCPSVASSFEEEVSKTQVELEMEMIVNDILKELSSVFRLNKRFVTVNSDSGEQNIYVAPTGVTYPGFFIEKYRVDIYEVQGEEDVYKGKQELTFTLEVSDYFIKCNPLCIDFGICFSGTAYQVDFELTNFSNVTQPIGVKVPSQLSYYVWTDQASVFVRSGETRRINLKFLPSCDLRTDKNKYFEVDTSILYFPIQIKLLNKKCADAPPLIQHVYAIVSDCAELTLDPTSTEHYESIDGQMVLNMGKCSVNESVSVEFILRNSSYSTRYFCFTDLPNYMTIMPNYGIGSIHSFQEILLKLYIHPRLENFEKGGGETQKYWQEKNVTIFVDTLVNVGKYRRKPDLNRLLKLMKLVLKELRRPTDIDILKDIFESKFTIRTEMNLCSCSSAMQIKSHSERKLQDSDTSLIEIKTADFEAEVDGHQTNITTENDTKILHQKKKKHLKTKSRSTEIVAKSDSNTHLDKTMKRKSVSKLKSDSEIEHVTPGVTETNEEDAEEEYVLVQQPSLLEKKAVSPLGREPRMGTPKSSLVNLAATLSKELRLRMVFTRPQYEFSYNYIEFPSTPGASYSMMATELRPLKNTGGSCVCGFEYRAFPKESKCRATFRIAGSTQEVRVEPTFGVLKHGESAKLSLVATPKINDDVVAAYAFDRRKSSIFQSKMAEELRRREDSLNRKSKKKQKNRKEKGKGNEQTAESRDESIQIEITPEEVQIDSLDFYPAEIALWRSIEPYFLNTSFVCSIEYEMDGSESHPPDVFSLETICKVIPPEVIHDQKSQRLDFGQVVVGESKKRIITVQNLKYKDIRVTTSILRPDGCFSCPNFDSIQLPSESFLKIPITFTPTREENVQEYMEIKAGRTNYQFLLSAESAIPNVRLEPASKVIRVVARKGKLLEIPFVVVNDSLLPVTVTFEKICELEGRMTSLPPSSNIQSNLHLKRRDTSKKIMRHSSSDELTEDEIYSIGNVFIKKEGARGVVKTL